jgi:hypothetical protein
MADAPSATNSRTPFLLRINDSLGVIVQLKESSYSAALRTALGLESLGANGEPPTGTSIAGKGKAAALSAGCFGVNLVYQRTATKTQTAKVLVAPSKADTVFVGARGASYNGKNIVEVRAPRRRIFVF